MYIKITVVNDLVCELILRPLHDCPGLQGKLSVFSSTFSIYFLDVYGSFIQSFPPSSEVAPDPKPGEAAAMM
jgi:hypothetical protein